MRTALSGAAVRAVPRGRLTAIPGAGSQIAKGMSLPAPVGGWDAVSSLADMDEDRAIVLDNWFPRPDSVEVRRGFLAHCDGMGNGAVESLLVYQGLTTATSKLFAVTGGSIYDATVSGNAVVSTVTGLNNNRCQYVNFTTAGGKFLWVCNGADNPRIYNGTTWALATISGITATDIIHVNAHKFRLWFTIKDSTKAAYLATNAIIGPATEFDLGALFTKGGYLNAMATWTRDGGSGQDDYAVFLSSRGQAAVYQGTDPASDATWSLVGVFDVGAPIGRRCFLKVGGDVALINIDGVLPLSLALQTDRAAAAKVALTRNINNAMNEAARSYRSNFGWQLTAYAKGTMVLLNVPVQEALTQHQYVMNTLTGAWCRFTGWNASCIEVFNDRLFFGGNTGRVNEADMGALDLDQPIDAIGQTAYSYYKSHGVLKSFGIARALVTTNSDLRPAIGMSTDYKDNAIVGTPSTAGIAVALFDVAVFDVDVFAAEAQSISDWASIEAQGHCGSIHFRARTGQDLTLWGTAVWGDPWSVPVTTANITVRISAFDVIYKLGGFM